MATRVQDLPVEERLKLVEDLWDSIAVDQSSSRLTEAQKAELDSRLDEFELDGILGESAGIVLKEIRASLLFSRFAYAHGRAQI